MLAPYTMTQCLFVCHNPVFCLQCSVKKLTSDVCIQAVQKTSDNRYLCKGCIGCVCPGQKGVKVSAVSTLYCTLSVKNTLKFNFCNYYCTCTFENFMQLWAKMHVDVKLECWNNAVMMSVTGKLRLLEISAWVWDKWLIHLVCLLCRWIRMHLVYGRINLRVYQFVASSIQTAVKTWW